jgi:hypothetical protein
VQPEQPELPEQQELPLQKTSEPVPEQRVLPELPAQRPEPELLLSSCSQQQRQEPEPGKELKRSFFSLTISPRFFLDLLLLRTAHLGSGIFMRQRLRPAGQKSRVSPRGAQAGTGVSGWVRGTIRTTATPNALNVLPAVLPTNLITSGSLFVKANGNKITKKAHRSLCGPFEAGRTLLRLLLLCGSSSRSSSRSSRSSFCGRHRSLCRSSGCCRSCLLSGRSRSFFFLLAASGQSKC